MKLLIIFTLTCLFTFSSAFAESDISISTDTDSYIHGQVVNISGTTSEKTVSLQVKDPSGKNILIRTISADGTFSFDLNMSTQLIVGKYEITASVTVDGVPKIANTSIYLLDAKDMSAATTMDSIQTSTESSEEGGGCLIATAAFGSEMAPQVQFLRELRDNTVLQTTSGTSFMNGFNQFYYSFSPQIADYERENPVFKETVKVTLTPLLTSLTLLNYVEIDTEEEMLGYGISIIILNIGMYFVAPAVLIIALKRKFL